MRETILEILQGLHPDVTFEGNDALVDSKVLDSFDIVSLISELNDEFDIVITADKIIPENFNSVDALLALVESLVDED